MKNHSIFVLLLLVAAISFSQNKTSKIDSLKLVLSNSKKIEKTNIYYFLAEEYLNINADSSLFYYEKMKALASPFKQDSLAFRYQLGLARAFSKKQEYEKAEDAFNAAEKLKDSNNIRQADFYFYRGYNHSDQTNFETAKRDFEKALKYSKKAKNIPYIISSYHNIAGMSQQLGNYEEAITLQQKSLKMAKEINDVEQISKAYTNISILYQKLGELEDAEKYIFYSLRIDDSLQNKHGIIIDYISLGIVNRKIGIRDSLNSRLESARDYYKKALELSEKISYSVGKGASLTNLALVEANLKNYDQAASYGVEAVNFNVENKNVFGELISRLNLGDAYRLKRDFTKAEDQMQQSLALAKKVKFQEGIQENYITYSQLLEDKGEYSKALSYYKKFTALKDSLSGTEVKNKINELEIKYETEKKERDLAESKANLIEKELQVKRKNYVIYGSLALAILLGFIGFLFYNQQKLKNRQLQKEGELKAALAKIETQNQLQEQRLRISRDLHDNIGSQLTFIISSIDNLKFGLKDASTVVTDKLESISNFTSQTIYELRDTIWAMNKTDISVEDLQARISNFIEKARVSSDIDFHFHVSGDFLSEKNFTSVQGMNIYRIIQEAVNNALKHSDATEISVEISKLSSSSSEDIPKEQIGITSYKMEIIDNGKGFDLDKTSFGNGLQNIKKRANDLGGTVEVTSEKDRGTTLRLVF